jgi:hypothetical protein
MPPEKIKYRSTAWQHSLQGVVVDVSLIGEKPLPTQAHFNTARNDTTQHGKPLFADATTLGLLGKSQEYSLITKSIIQSQAKTLLLLGDAGLGKTHLLHVLLRGMAELAPHQYWHISPQQAIVLQIPEFPPMLPLGESLLHVLREALMDWATCVLDVLLSMGNACLRENRCHLSTEWFATHLEASAGVTGEVERHTYWYKEALHRLREHQGMVDKLLRPQSTLAEQVAFHCASPWGHVAFHVLQHLAQPRTTLPEQEAELLSLLEFMGHRLRNGLHHPHYPATFTLMLDGWDALLEHSPVEQQEASALLKRLLRHVNDQKQMPLHIVLATRANDISRQLGSTGYALCRQKMLLSPLAGTDLQRLIECSIPMEEGTEAEAHAILAWFQQASHGNPEAVNDLLEHVKQQITEDTDPLTPKAIEALYIDDVEQLYGMLYTRLQLDVLEKGPLFLKAFQRFIQHADTRPFEPTEHVEALKGYLPAGCTLDHLKEAIQQLYFYGVLVPWVPPTWMGKAEGLYRIPSRSKLAYLKGLSFNPEQAMKTPGPHQGLQVLAQQLEEWLGNVRHTEYLFDMIPALFAKEELTPKKLAHCTQVAKALPPDVQQPLFEEAASFLFHALSNHESEHQRVVATQLLPELPLHPVSEWLLTGLEDEAEAVKLACFNSLGLWPAKAKQHKLTLSSESQQHTLKELISYLQHPFVQHNTLCDALFQTLSQWAMFAPSELLHALKEAFFAPHETPKDEEEADPTVNGLKTIRPLVAMPFSDGVFKVLIECQRHVTSSQLPEVHALSLRLITLHWKQQAQIYTHSVTVFCTLPPELPGLLGCFTLGWQSPCLSNEQRKALFAMVCRLIPHHGSALQVFGSILKELLAPETLQERLRHPEETQRMLERMVTVSQYIQHWPLEAKQLVDAQLSKALSLAVWQNHLEVLWVLLRLHHRVLQHPRIKNEAGVKQLEKWQQHLGGLAEQGFATAHFVKQLLSV